jgi:hypothetical protein
MLYGSGHAYKHVRCQGTGTRMCMDVARLKVCMSCLVDDTGWAILCNGLKDRKVNAAVSHASVAGMAAYCWPIASQYSMSGRVLQLELWAGMLRVGSATMEEVQALAGLENWPSVQALYRGGKYNVDSKLLAAPHCLSSNAVVCGGARGTR